MAPNLKATNDASSSAVIDRTRRQKRIELSNLLERFYFSDDGTVGLHPTEEDAPPSEEEAVHDGSYQDSTSSYCYCAQHEKVKVRNGRCPLCAAADTRSRRRSSCGSVESEGGCSNSSSGAHENDDEEGRGQLDPKWADALRQISSRLADVGRTCSSGDLCLNEMNHTADSAAAAGCHRPLSKSFNGGKSLQQQDSQQHHHHHLGSLSQLRQMIVMAQASVGRFTPNDDFDIDTTDNDTNRHQEGERENHSYNDEEDDDSLLDRSISSMMESQIKNNFAESKGLSSEQRGRLDTIVKQFVPVSSLQRTSGGGDDDHVNLIKNTTDKTFQHQENQLLSSNNKELPKSMTVVQLLPPNKIGSSDGTLISSHSDSSITLSLSSSSSTGVGCCLESRNGTVTATTAAASSTHDSPTCVLEMPQCSSSSAKSSSLSPTAMETTGRGGEPNIPFGPPFDSSLKASPFCSKAPDGRSSKNTSKQQSVSSAAPPTPTVEEVYSDTDEEENDDGEATVAPIPSSSSKGPPPPTASSRPSRRQCSFISALVQNARSSRSKSRSRASRSRSKSRGRAKSRSKSRGRRGSSIVEQRDVAVDDIPEESSEELKCTEHSREAEPQPEPVIRGDQQDAVVQSNSTQIMNNPEPATPSRNDVPPAANTPKPQPEYIRLCPKYEFPPLPSGVRGPILHPDYQLGDPAQERDMIVFPSCKSRKGRRRHRKRHGNGDHDNDDDSSDEESHDRFSSAKLRSIVESAIGQLCHLDAAFVRRSDGSWTYAIMADRTQDAIRFVVNEKGSTKSYPQKLWGSSVRRIRVLTQREGDRFLFKDCTNGGVAASKRRRSIGNSRGSRGRSLSKGKGRLTSPSPTRRNTGVLNIPPTILEHHRHGRH